MRRAEVGKIPDQDPDGEWYFEVFTHPVAPDDLGRPLSERIAPLPLVAGDRRHTHQEALDAALAWVGLTKDRS